MTQELLPCPFCGSHRISRHDGKAIISYITCDDCGGCAFMNVWNTRALPKMQKVDLDGIKKSETESHMNDGFECGYNAAIDHIKSKYGELYAEVK